jgi:hypothetical protein
LDRFLPWIAPFQAITVEPCVAALISLGGRREFAFGRDTFAFFIFFNEHLIVA